VCGIAGVVAPDIRIAGDEVLRAMASAIRFRGRDDAGSWTDGAHVHLLHTRLAIIDPAHGHQPMHDVDGVTTIAFAGEVHNHRELRARYEAAGARFTTNTDTEVLLEGYKLRGAAVCEDVVGMFAFALWDHRRNELLLARDRLGEKPLFWSSSGGALWFASSCDALAATPDWSGRLSPEGMAQRTAAGAPLGADTVFADARAVLPGSYLWVAPDGSAPRSSRYWSMGFDPLDRRDAAALVDDFGHLLTDAVALRLHADVPVAITFSAGVDSGAIAVAARDVGSHVPLVTLDHHTADEPSPETDRARAVSARLGMPWVHEEYDYRETFLDDLRTGIALYDQPPWQPELVQVTAVSERIARDAKVALAGCGGDELLLGYRGDERLRRLDLLRRAAGPAARLAGGRLDPLHHLTGRLRAAASASPLGDGDLAIEPALQALTDGARAAGASSALQIKTYYSLTWGNVEPNYITPDIAGLSRGVEIRSPLLDHRVVDFATRLPDRVKVRWPWTPRGNKWLAKEWYGRAVGREHAFAPKINMGGNVRWDLELVRNRGWRAFAEEAITGIERAGLNAAPSRRAWAQYVADIEGDRTPGSYTAAIRGVMLGLWLGRLRS
jgi:asparagine synthase (glutamine-hydrolysing)